LPLLKPTFSSEHHEGEETVLFPEIEKITGEKGIMEKNIEQHHAFLPGLEAWIKYISECRKNEGSDFDAARFTQLIDGCAAQLTAHLTGSGGNIGLCGASIPTLCLERKGHWCSCRRRTCKIPWLGIDNSSQMFCYHL